MNNKLDAIPHNPRAATVDQVAYALQCGAPFVRRLQASGAIPSYRLGNRILRFDIPAVIDALTKPKATQ